MNKIAHLTHLHSLMYTKYTAFVQMRNLNDFLSNWDLVKGANVLFMKKRVILTAAIIGALSELAAVIYTIHIRSDAVIGGEYFILPFFIMAAYCVLEIIGTAERKKETDIRLTRRTKYGDAVLNHEAFPEYDRETLIHEIFCFEPMKVAVEKLCAYEERGD